MSKKALSLVMIKKRILDKGALSKRRRTVSFSEKVVLCVSPNKQLQEQAYIYKVQRRGLRCDGCRFSPWCLVTGMMALDTAEGEAETRDGRRDVNLVTPFLHLQLC